MTTITVTPRNKEEYNLVMAVLHQLKVKVGVLKQKDISPMTMVEYNALIDESLESARTGGVVSHEELKKKAAKW